MEAAARAAGRATAKAMKATAAAAARKATTDSRTNATGALPIASNVPAEQDPLIQRRGSRARTTPDLFEAVPK